MKQTIIVIIAVLAMMIDAQAQQAPVMEKFVNSDVVMRDSATNIYVPKVIPSGTMKLTLLRDTMEVYVSSCNAGLQFIAKNYRLGPGMTLFLEYPSESNSIYMIFSLSQKDFERLKLLINEKS